MVDGRTHDIPLAEARLLIQRAIDKAEQLQLRGGIAVYGGSGALVSVSRMDRGGAGGMARARSKAWISATQQIPSADHLKRMNFVSAPVEQGFKTASPEALFPGAGGMPIFHGGGAGEVIGGIAASGATVSPFFPAGIPQENMIANGKPANPEDLLIHYALGLPYVGQHGDDVARWSTSFGEFPANAPEGLGMADAPRASQQFEHEWALALADAVLREAAGHGVRVVLAITDHRGDAIQQDAADGAATSRIVPVARARGHCRNVPGSEPRGRRALRRPAHQRGSVAAVSDPDQRWRDPDHRGHRLRRRTRCCGRRSGAVRRDREHAALASMS